MNSEYQFLLNSVPNQSTYGSNTNNPNNLDPSFSNGFGGFNYFNPNFNNSNNVPNSFYPNAMMNQNYQYGQFNPSMNQTPSLTPGFGGIPNSNMPQQPVAPTFPNNYLNDFSNQQNQGPNIIKRSKKEFFEGNLKVNGSPLMNSIAPKINSNKKSTIENQLNTNSNTNTNTNANTNTNSNTNDNTNVVSLKKLIAQIKNIINS